MNTITVSLGQNTIIKLITNKFTIVRGNNMYEIFTCCNNILCYPKEQKYIELFDNIKIECDYYSVMKVLDNNLFFFLKDNETNEILWGKNVSDSSYEREIEKFSFYLERLTEDEQKYFIDNKEEVDLGYTLRNKNKDRMIIDLDYYFYWKLKYDEDVFYLKDEDF